MSKTTKSPYRRFSYQGSQRTRFGFYGPSDIPGHVTRHECRTRRERDVAYRAARSP